MWKDYSIGFIKKNRASSISVLAAAFISAMFLSLLCSLFYNFWQYEIESIVLEEGGWQGRIFGTFDGSIVSEIENFANVKAAEINEKLSDEQNLVIDICFQNMRTIYRDLPLIAEHFGLDDSAVTYHELLLSRYFIHDPQDADPPADGLLPGSAAYRICVSDSDYSQLFCSLYESPCASVRYIFQHRGNAWANPHMLTAGSGGSLHSAHFVRNLCRNRVMFRNDTAHQLSCSRHCGQTRSSLFISPGGTGSHDSGSHSDSFYFRMAACKKIKQVDTACGNTVQRRVRSEKETKIRYIIPNVWCGG